MRKLQKYFVGEVIWSKFIVIQRKNNIYELRVEFVITHDIEPVKWALKKNQKIKSLLHKSFKGID